MTGSATIDGTLSVLLIENDPTDAGLLTAQVESRAEDIGAAAVGVTHRETLEAAVDALKQSPIDLVILDLSLPCSTSADWRDSLRQIRTQVPQVPIVALGERADPRLELDALRAGAQEFLHRPLPSGATFARVLRCARERQLRENALMLAQRDQLRQSGRAVAASDRAVGIVSHDLGNHLSTIQICATALLDREPPPLHGIRRMAQIIQRSASWMQQIVQDLLDRASLDAGKLVLDRRPTPVSELIGAAQVLFAPVAEEKPLEFVVQAPAERERVDADSHRLLQALSNLLSNAMKFTPPGGQVVLSARVVQAPGSGVPGSGDPEHGIRFAVSDSGPGIALADLSHIFDWFWQAQPGSGGEGRGGAGLGLAIAKGLIEAHGARLRVESPPGLGCTFSFTVPAVA